MGYTKYEVNILPDKVWIKLFEIKDFLLLMKVIEHLENLQMTEIITFHLCTIIYEEKDLKKMLGG